MGSGEGRGRTAVVVAGLIIQTAVDQLNRKVETDRIGDQLLLEPLEVVVAGVFFEEGCECNLVVSGLDGLVVDVVQFAEAVGRDGRLALGRVSREGSSRCSRVKLERKPVKYGRAASTEVAEAGGGLDQVDMGGNVVRDAVREGAESRGSQAVKVLVPGELGAQQLVGGAHRGSEGHPVVLDHGLHGVIVKPASDGGNGVVGRGSVGPQLVAGHVHAVVGVARGGDVENGLVKGAGTVRVVAEGDAEEDELVWGGGADLFPAAGDGGEAVDDPGRG